MLRNLFTYEGFVQFCLWIPVILLSISFHEFAHGYIAYKLGDPTAKIEGRLSMNPLRHFNVLGFLMMVIVHFGWATPVPVNPNNFKNPSRGMLYTALAGPCANMILALVGSLLYAVFSVFVFPIVTPTSSDFTVNLIINSATILLYLTYMNIGLAFFNLIPIYPLDGSRILGYFMPEQYHRFMMRYGQYVQIAFVLLLVLTSVVGNIISAVQNAVAGAMIDLWLIPINRIMSLF